jgi:hypothetical protein
MHRCSLLATVPSLRYRGRMLLPLLLLACSGASKDADTGTSDSADTGSTVDVCDQEAPACIDDMILDFSLHDDKTNDGEVTTSTDGEDFVTIVDASAGGSSNSANRAWVYFRFDADGATKIETDDESALESSDWHLSIRRYIVRLNSGDSGPSCVGADEMSRKTYEEVTEVPSDASFAEEDFYNDECALVEDNSGLPGSPAVVLGGWWSYENAVVPTLVPFLVQIEDGRVLKLVIEDYDDGVYTIRWRWME